MRAASRTAPAASSMSWSDMKAIARSGAAVGQRQGGGVGDAEVDVGCAARGGGDQADGDASIADDAGGRAPSGPPRAPLAAPDIDCQPPGRRDQVEERVAVELPVAVVAGRAAHATQSWRGLPRTRRVAYERGIRPVLHGAILASAGVARRARLRRGAAGCRELRQGGTQEAGSSATSGSASIGNQRSVRAWPARLPAWSPSDRGSGSRREGRPRSRSRAGASAGSSMSATYSISQSSRRTDTSCPSSQRIVRASASAVVSSGSIRPPGSTQKSPSIACCRSTWSCRTKTAATRGWNRHASALDLDVAHGPLGAHDQA